MTDEQYRTVIAHLLHMEYQQRLVIWALGGYKPSQKPMPPAGVTLTTYPDGTTDTAAHPEGLQP